MIEQDKEAATDWTRSVLDRALTDLADLDVMRDALIETRVTWSMPGKLLVGQARFANDPNPYIWFISGDIPTDYIGAAAAATPRDALRHFSMKWQMDAERYRDPETRKAHGLDESKDWAAMTARLIAKAEELYAISADDRFWQNMPQSEFESPK